MLPERFNDLGQHFSLRLIFQTLTVRCRTVRVIEVTVQAGWPALVPNPAVLDAAQWRVGIRRTELFDRKHATPKRLQKGAGTGIYTWEAEHQVPEGFRSLRLPARLRHDA